jgi:AraC-like DNA-binding protein
MTTLERSSAATTLVSIAGDVDVYSGALPGIDLDVVRTGFGFGPNVARSVTSPGVMVASCIVQFPVFGRTTIMDDRVVVGLLTAAPPGTRWCGIDLEPGMMLMYGPGAEHTGVSPAGVAFVALSVSMDHLEATADQLHRRLGVPRRGQVSVAASKPDSRSLFALLGSSPDPRAEPARESVAQQDAVYALVSALSRDDSSTAPHKRQRIADSRSITASCIALADTIGRPPSIAEMCAAAHASERRVRTAFTDSYDMAPHGYFLVRSLSSVWTRLVDRHDGSSIEQLAMDAGFGTLGRFSRYYRSTFGELPSATRRRALRS